MEKYTKEQWSNKLMEPTDIHGKDYYMVHERVMEFHRRYPDGSIKTGIVEMTDDRFITRTVIKPFSDRDVMFTGLAYENIASGGIMSTSALECCETSSVGRALGFLNIGIEGGIASAEEVKNATSRDNYKNTKSKSAKKSNNIAKNTEQDGKANAQNVSDFDLE